MKDRVSTKILDNGATRYGVYDETGKLLRYEYIKLEDEPTVEGDLFSKANMLPDSIPAALGLKMGNPQVKDALNVLAHVGNLHVWEKSEKANPIVYSSSTVAVELGSTTTYTFGGTVEIENGAIVLKNTFTAQGNADSSILVGCYFKKDGVVYRVGGFNTNTSTTTTWDMIKVSIDTSSYVPGNTIEYKISTDSSSYPADGVQDDYYYTYVGQLGDPGAKIEVGSYVGTGTYGSSNPNSLTFGFEPKIVKLLFRTRTNVGIGNLKYEDLTGEGFSRSQNFMVADRLIAEYAQGEGFGYSYSSSYGKKSPDGKTFYWYSTDAANQCNSSGYVYYYIAIC